MDFGSSPRNFFSLYSESNGYKNLEVYIADLTNWKHWYQVEKPENGRRAEVTSNHPLYVLVRAELKSNHFSHEKILQSDYIHTWNDAASRAPARKIKTTPLSAIRSLLKKNDWLYRVVHERLHKRVTIEETLLNGLKKNKNLQTIRVSNLL